MPAAKNLTAGSLDRAVLLIAGAKIAAWCSLPSMAFTHRTLHALHLPRRLFSVTAILHDAVCSLNDNGSIAFVGEISPTTGNLAARQ